MIPAIAEACFGDWKMVPIISPRDLAARATATIVRTELIKAYQILHTVQMSLNSPTWSKGMSMLRAGTKYQKEAQLCFETSNKPGVCSTSKRPPSSRFISQIQLNHSMITCHDRSKKVLHRHVDNNSKRNPLKIEEIFDKIFKVSPLFWLLTCWQEENAPHH